MENINFLDGIVIYRRFGKFRSYGSLCRCFRQRLREARVKASQVAQRESSVTGFRFELLEDKHSESGRKANMICQEEFAGAPTVPVPSADIVSTNHPPP